MHTEIRDKALRDAGHHLAQALKALHEVGAYDLAQPIFTSANAVLRARQALPRTITVAPDAELRTRALTVEVR